MPVGYGEYCMPSNDNHYRERTQAGKVRQSYKEGKPYRCHDCKRNIFRRRWGGRVEDDVLILHHITPLPWGGSSEEKNLIPLCNRCHDIRHAEMRLAPELPLFRERTIVGYRKGSVFTE